MLKNSKIKKLLALSVCPSAFFICATSASATIKKAVTSVVGATSGLSKRTTAQGSSLNTWSSYKGTMQKLKSEGASLSEQSRLSRPKPIQGKFINSSGKQILANVYTKNSDEGLKVNYVKTNDGDEVVVTYVGDGVYARSLSLEELKLFDRVNHGLLNTGLDTLGKEHIIVVADGEGGEIAYQFSNGTWRDVRRDVNRNIYLGHQVDVNNLSDGLKNRLFADIKEIIDSALTVGLDIPKGDK